jgi:hypothetical protein
MKVMTGKRSNREGLKKPATREAIQRRHCQPPSFAPSPGRHRSWLPAQPALWRGWQRRGLFLTDLIVMVAARWPMTAATTLEIEDFAAVQASASHAMAVAPPQLRRAVATRALRTASTEKAVDLVAVTNCALPAVMYGEAPTYPPAPRSGGSAAISTTVGSSGTWIKDARFRDSGGPLRACGGHCRGCIAVARGGRTTMIRQRPWNQTTKPEG